MIFPGDGMVDWFAILVGTVAFIGMVRWTRDIVPVVGRSKICLGIFYRRKKAHLGPAKASTATARKLAGIVYNLLKYKDQYREPDPVTYQLKIEETILAKLQKQAATLGYKLLPNALLPA